ncbi:MAG: hypothetical protein IT422_17845 [Pirellulaceae bacterium]|jgi:hypothetical protein|nr:hypothetical protein [Pirellulaceae bacterium]
MVKRQCKSHSIVADRSADPLLLSQLSYAALFSFTDTCDLDFAKHLD